MILILYLSYTFPLEIQIKNTLCKYTIYHKNQI